MKTFEFLELDRKVVKVVDVADDNPVAETLANLEHLNGALHAKMSRLEGALEKIYNECSCDTPEVCFDIAKAALGKSDSTDA